MKSKIKQQKAITLVALIITIVVLLILATVSIRLVINGGILGRAQNGVNQYSEEEIAEQWKLALAEYEMSQFTGNDANIQGRLEKIYGEGNVTGVKLKNGTITATITKNGETKTYRYTSTTGKVEEYNSILPDEYQQVEYIESTGTQYIDTGFFRPDNFILTCEAMFTARISQAPNCLFSNESLDISLYSDGRMGMQAGSPIVTIGEWQTFSMGIDNSNPRNKFLKCNDNIINYQSSYVQNQQWCIFNHTYYKSYSSAARLKEFTITDFSGNTVIMRGIPALDENNKPCIYDTVSKNVFYNSGSGEFGYKLEDGTCVEPQ